MSLSDRDKRHKYNSFILLQKMIGIKRVKLQKMISIKRDEKHKLYINS